MEGALVPSKDARDLLWGIGRCLWQLGALPQTLVWDREGAHLGIGLLGVKIARLGRKIPVFCCRSVRDNGQENDGDDRR